VRRNPVRRELAAYASMSTVLPDCVRAVVTDLDGTIVRSDGSISPATAAAATALHLAGIPLIAATARTPAGIGILGPVQDQLTAAVCCNGAIGLGTAGRDVAWQDVMDPGVVSDLAGWLAAELPGAGIGAYDGQGWSLSPEYYAARGRAPRGSQQVMPVGDFGRRHFCVVAVCHAEVAAATLAAMLSASGLLDGRATVDYGADDIVDIAPPGADKGTGVRRALALLGIDPARAVAFGDGPNDRAMIGAVGRFVAVASGFPDVLAAATEVTEGIDGDGFAGWLRRAGLDF
jgi:hydroxymethylpyrimidine pyrophosphatase-like HAD family hydrolase